MFKKVGRARSWVWGRLIKIAEGLHITKPEDFEPSGYARRPLLPVPTEVVTVLSWVSLFRSGA
jgi:hypothetical protein